MGKTLAAVVALFVGINAAAAQDLRGQPVTERPREGYDPLGMRAGSFLVLPSVSLGVTYDDNVYAQESDKNSDYVYVIAPRLLVRSDWNVHYLALRASAEVGRFSDYSTEDYEDYDVGLDGRLDVLEGYALTGTADYRREHDERGTPSDVGGREPTEYDWTYAALGFNRTGTRITLRVLGTVSDFNFDDTRTAANAVVDQDYRDRVEYVGSARVGYEFVPGVSTFAQGSLNARDYDGGSDTEDRSSDGYRLHAGFAFDLGGITTGEVYAGYRSQDYDNPAYDTQTGFSYGGSLLWNPTGLTSIQLSLVNDVNESTQSGSSGYVASGATLEVDHELLRNVLIGGVVGYTENDYRGIDRLEKVWTAGTRADYLVNRWLRAGISYRLIDRSVNVGGQDYSRNQVTLNVRGSF